MWHLLYGVLFMSQKIYVGNLGYSVTESTLADTFAEFGTVNSAKVIIDRDTNRSKGFAFIEMSSSTEASRAISGLNGVELEGRNMNVSEAKEMAPKARTNSRW
jgi:RNA recognition motif-containing protein